jgi:hypothetical protein
LNHDNVRALFNHLDLFAGFQIPRGVRLCPHALDRGHHVRLLIRRHIAQRGRPSQVLRQFIEHARKLQQRIYGGIPFLVLCCLHQRIAG